MAPIPGPSVFCSGSIAELVCASATRQCAGLGQAVLLFDLGINHEPKFVRQEVLRITPLLGWDRIVFLEPDIYPPRVPESAPAVRRLMCELRRCRVVHDGILQRLATALGEAWASTAGRGATVYFDYLHEYVLHLLGILPHARRVMYPHGLDQPHRQQLRSCPFYYAGRRRSTGLRTLRQQYGHVRRSLWMVAPWLWWTRGVRLPLPFTGVDYVYAFSPHAPGNAFERVPFSVIQSILERLAHGLPQARELEAALSEIDVTGVGLVLLPEQDAEYPSTNYGAAMGRLLDRVAQKAAVATFFVKPHPRSGHARYLSFLQELRGLCPQYDLRVWPMAGRAVLTEVICTRWRFRCVCSLGSCTLPPWASSGVPHYVSRSAGRHFDEGYCVPGRRRYEELIGVLEEEGIVVDLG